jgi:uncharacterized protein
VRTQESRWWLLTAVALLVGVTAGCASEADRMKGTWRGTLDLGRVKPGATLRVVCNVQKNADGTLAGTLDSPDQGATGIPLDAVTVKDGAFHLQLNKLFASYDGTVSKDHQEIVGQWKQGPNSLPLTFKKD